MLFGVTLFQVSSKYCRNLSNFVKVSSKFRRSFVEVSSKFRRILSNIVKVLSKFRRILSNIVKFRQSFVKVSSKFVESRHVLSKCCRSFVKASSKFRPSFVEVLSNVAQNWLQNGFRLASKWQASKSGFKMASKYNKQQTQGGGRSSTKLRRYLTNSTKLRRNFDEI